MIAANQLTTIQTLPPSSSRDLSCLSQVSRIPVSIPASHIRMHVFCVVRALGIPVITRLLNIAPISLPQSSSAGIWFSLSMSSRRLTETLLYHLIIYVLACLLSENRNIQTDRFLSFTQPLLNTLDNTIFTISPVLYHCYHTVNRSP